ncbi:TPA: restriction endonuclease subunit S, partial [Streptococcus suis]
MPNKDRNIPKRRFKAFENADAWELRPLGEIGNTYTGLSGKTKDDFGHGDGRFVTYMNVFSNPISLPEMVEAVEIDESQNTVRYGDVLFTTSSETPEEVGMSSVWLGNTENTYLNSFCFGFRPVKKVNPYYLAYLLRSSGMRRKISFLAQGISRYNISKTKMMELEISIPNANEQKAIGTFFSDLDQLITLHQRKLDKLKHVKQAYLSEMFPAEGERVPKRRFPGFTD